ncbi:MAG: hypothetical protein Q9M14_00795, partial [Mariprofundaceae bacterium]|nr:hypothetical protein [Mariprofundaceae bacterium]
MTQKNQQSGTTSSGVHVHLTMPGLTILAMDCFPTHRGTAASMQGFLQMGINAVVASIAVPLLQIERLNFVLGQGFFLPFLGWTAKTTEASAKGDPVYFCTLGGFTTNLVRSRRELLTLNTSH